MIAQETDNVVIITDRDGRTEWVNPVFTRCSGYTLAEVVGRKPGDVLQGPATDAGTVRRIGDALRAGQKIRTEIVNYTKDGRTYWLDMQIQPILNEQGQIHQFIAIELDITQRKLAEQSLRTSEEQHRIALSAANLGTWKHDLATGMIHLDERGRTHYGFGTAVIPMVDLLARVHPDDRAQLGREIGGTIDPALGDGCYATKYRLVDPSGAVRWLSVQAKVYYESEGAMRCPVLSVGTVQNITTRKQTEAQLREKAAQMRAVVENVADGLITIDHRGCILTANKAAQQIFGYPRKS